MLFRPESIMIAYFFSSSSRILVGLRKSTSFVQLLKILRHQTSQYGNFRLTDFPVHWHTKVLRKKFCANVIDIIFLRNRMNASNSFLCLVLHKQIYNNISCPTIPKSGFICLTMVLLTIQSSCILSLNLVLQYVMYSLSGLLMS